MSKAIMAVEGCRKAVLGVCVEAGKQTLGVSAPGKQISSVSIRFWPVLFVLAQVL